MKPGKKRQSPYIELNGVQYPDSNLIIDMLKQKFHVNPDKDLNEVRRHKFENEAVTNVRKNKTSASFNFLNFSLQYNIT